MVVELYRDRARRARYVRQWNARERLTNQMVELTGGGNLQHCGYSLHQLVRALARGYGKEDLRCREVLLLIERRRVYRRLYNAQRNRDGIRGDDCLEQFAELLVETAEARGEVIMLIVRQMARLNAHREGRQRASEPEHRLEE